MFLSANEYESRGHKRDHSFAWCYLLSRTPCRFCVVDSDYYEMSNNIIHYTDAITRSSVHSNG